MISDRLIGNWEIPTNVRFGPGRVKELSGSCRDAGMRRPLLVTDPGLAQLSVVKDAIARNERDGIPTGLFSQVKANPVGRNIEDGAAAFRRAGHDGVIAFGGGSALDAGKAIALLSGQSKPLWAFEDAADNWKEADAAGIAPVVAVPTTAGTGSEVGRGAIILNEQTQLKRTIFHPRMMPAVVLADPELTLNLPPHMTAATGMDALTHCLEAYCAPVYHPLAEGVAVEGMRLIRQWLPVAVAEGENITARSHMMATSIMGATSFQKGLGAIHSLSHQISAIYDTHHGLTNAVIMPYVLKHNREAVDAKLTRLAAWIGLPNRSFEAVLQWIVALREEIGIPPSLKAIGIGKDRGALICEMAAHDPTALTNPIPLSASALQRIFERAVDGEL